MIAIASFANVILFMDRLLDVICELDSLSYKKAFNNGEGLEMEISNVKKSQGDHTLISSVRVSSSLN